MTRQFENYLYNKTLQLGKQAKEQNGTLRCATDSKGRIVDQHMLSAYRMGRVTSENAGCGWVACYNALRLLGKPQNAARTILELETAFVFGGKRGTRTVQLAPYFLKKGFSVSFSTTRAAAQKKAKGCAANIIYYVRGDLRTAHFVAFSPADGEKDGAPLFCWYNALSAPLLPRAPFEGAALPCVCFGGDAGDLRTLADLLAPEKSIFWIVMHITSKT